MVAIEFSTWRSGRIGGASGSWTTGKDRAFAAPGSCGGKGRSLADQESIGGDAERGVVMESSPASSFEMGEAEFALEFLIVAFDAPAQFRGIDENFDRSVFGQGREPVFGRLALGFGPLDQQPFEQLWGRELAVSRGGPYPHGGEARGQGLVGALTPGHVSPGFFRQRRRQRLGRDRPMIGVAPRA